MSKSNPGTDEIPVGGVIVKSSTTAAGSAEELARRFRVLLGQEVGPDCNIYGRFGSVNSKSVERALLRHELGAAAALTFASGMAAITTTMLALLQPGQVLICSKPVYGCTDDLVRNILAKWGIKTVFVDTSNMDMVSDAVHQNRDQIGVVFIESPSNPIIRLSDIKAISDLVKHVCKNAWVVVDNTFLGPLFQHPFELGADIVIYSATKFLGGHSDIVGGVVLTARAEDMNMILACRHTTGPIMAPEVCWLLERSLGTLGMRMLFQSNSAQSIAKMMSEHPTVERVLYPGLLSSSNDPEQFAIFRTQCTGPGSMISVYLRGGRQTVFSFQDALEEYLKREGFGDSIAVSLGGIHTLQEHPASTSHAGVPEEERLQAGITENLVRISVGAEVPEVLHKAIGFALDKIAA
ncbi:MAG: aminotransferase class I/II-fold pyridoxal phosphate-dependent enzyme [Patescibacteria group bacterium]|jgi:methionine-gamma-lyase